MTEMLIVAIVFTNVLFGAALFLWLAGLLVLKGVDTWLLLNRVRRDFLTWIWYKDEFLEWLADNKPEMLSDRDRRRLESKKRREL